MRRKEIIEVSSMIIRLSHGCIGSLYHININNRLYLREGNCSGPTTIPMYFRHHHHHIREHTLLDSRYLIYVQLFFFIRFGVDLQRICVQLQDSSYLKINIYITLEIILQAVKQKRCRIDSYNWQSQLQNKYVFCPESSTELN